MSYQFKGNLKGMLCDDYCIEAIANVKIRIYRAIASREVVQQATAAAKETFHEVSAEELKSKESSLLAETMTDADGNFTIDFGRESKYEGEAFDIDFECGNVPRPKPYPKRLPVLQFHITTLQPKWRQQENDFLAYWEYQIPNRWWCAIRGKFDAWIICGRVINCKTKLPLKGLQVAAFDVDWLQDDPLGSNITDATGHFRIDYTSADFSKTLLPFLNVEWPAGPDLYFRITEPVSGAILLNEDRSTGHRADRTNRGPCFCIELCVPQDVTPNNEVPALFERVGGYDIGPTGAQFDANGYTTDVPKLAFYGGLDLNGTLPSGTNTNEMEYRFRIFNADTSYELTAAQVLHAMVPFKIGELLKQTGPVTWTHDPVIITPALNSAGELWITVPRGNNLTTGIFTPTNGVLARIDSSALALDASNTTFANNVFDLTSPTVLIAGTAVPAAQQAPIHTFKIVFEARKVGTTTLTAVNTLDKIVISNVSYKQRRHPGWGYTGDESIMAAAMLEIKETTGSGHGCGGITTTVTAQYTVCHPHVESFTLRFEGNPTLPAPFSSGPPPYAAEYHDNNKAFSTTGMEPCAYILWLDLQLGLTNGYQKLPQIHDHIAFCKTS
ncbi:MAG: hypothetical protein J7623_01850 [Chitinophaga sp.]|uniref:hypothetical protein n=1 Tax=Chitinophaga sp. TaxID=1869181 RepID=UPI001B288F33|nr:hypothetical protein [Chitinophaga sp.]MBO9727360.1 hypothetical protein [Chitinophaga sp.]